MPICRGLIDKILMKKYLISGIGPGKGGVGTLMISLIPRAEKYGYKVLFIHNPSESIYKLIKNKRIFRAFFELFKWLISRLKIHVKMSFMTNCELIFIYPQNIGYSLLFNLIDNNKVTIYIMDSSFFCIKSYNYLHGKECLSCVGGVKSYIPCQPFPKISSKKISLLHLNKLKANSKKIHFLAQNKSHGDLLKRHFGEDILLKIVGMDAGEINVFDGISAKDDILNSKIENEIIYHGNDVDAKGLSYVIALAERLPEYKFIIPLHNNNPDILPKNIVFDECSWATGLKHYVINSRLVLCPSIWSASIEGALLKSIAFNGNVAVFDSKYGFQNDIPDDVLLRLNYDLDISADSIRSFMNDNLDYSIKSKKWLNKYYSGLNDRNIFGSLE